MGFGSFNRNIERFSYAALTLLAFGVGGTLWYFMAFTEEFEAPAIKPLLACLILFTAGFMGLRKWCGMDRWRRRKLYGSRRSAPPAEVGPTQRLYPNLPIIKNEPVKTRAKRLKRS